MEGHSSNTEVEPSLGMAWILGGCAVVGRCDDDRAVESYLCERHVARVEVAVNRYYGALLLELQFEGVLARMGQES